MSKRKEKISAFLDSGIHQDELMSFSLSAEPEDAEIAQRYQMIGDALRGELNDASFIDVSRAVREALAGENIAHANTEITDQSRKSDYRSSSVVPSVWWGGGWFKPVAGFAFAVMIAVVMVLTISEQDGGVLAPVATNIDTPLVDQATAVADIGQKSSGSAVLPGAVTDKKATDIDPYINQHLEYATQDALQGRLPYIRAVNYEAGK